MRWTLGASVTIATCEALPYGIDTLWVAGQTLNLDLQDSLLWTVEVDEGLYWIRFDQRLDLVPAYFE